MKKSIIIAALAVLILFSLSVPAFAMEHIETVDALTQDQEADLEASAMNLKEKFGIDVFFVESTTVESAEELSHTYLSSRSITESYFIFAITNEYYYGEWSEDMTAYFKSGDVTYIYRSIADYIDDTYNFCLQYHSLISKILENRSSTPYKYIRDQAGILTDEQENNLNDRLTKLSEKHKFDIVIVTTNGVDPEDRMAFADDYFDYNGYGYGKDNDGVLLLVNIDPNQTYSTGNSWVSTCGKGIDYIGDKEIEKIGNRLTPLLLSGDYERAVDTFADMVVSDINFYTFFNTLIVIGVMSVFAAICAFIYTAKLKRALVSVVQAADANTYIIDGSLKIKRSYDHFLYSHVTKTERQSSSGSGSRSHTSSSGSSHGGGGF